MLKQWQLNVAANGFILAPKEGDFGRLPRGQDNVYVFKTTGELRDFLDNELKKDEAEPTRD